MHLGSLASCDHSSPELLWLISCCYVQITPLQNKGVYEIGCASVAYILVLLNPRARLALPYITYRDAASRAQRGFSVSGQHRSSAACSFSGSFHGGLRCIPPASWENYKARIAVYSRYDVQISRLIYSASPGSPLHHFTLLIPTMTAFNLSGIDLGSTLGVTFLGVALSSM